LPKHHITQFTTHERNKAIVAHFHEWLAGAAIPIGALKFYSAEVEEREIPERDN
jgi:hypothetical protein